MDDHLVHTTPNHHPSKMDFLSKRFLQIILAAKWLVRHSSKSPKQQRRPLSSLLSLSFFYVVRLDCGSTSGPQFESVEGPTEHYLACFHLSPFFRIFFVLFYLFRIFFVPFPLFRIFFVLFIFSVFSFYFFISPF